MKAVVVGLMVGFLGGVPPVLAQGGRLAMEMSRALGRLLVPSMALLSMAFLLEGCANHVRGKLVNLDNGDVISLRVNLASRGDSLEAVLEDGRRIGGEFRELPFTLGSTGRPFLDSGHVQSDPVVYGSGYLRDGKRVIEFEYWRSNRLWQAIGTAKDNEGRRFKLLL